METVKVIGQRLLVVDDERAIRETLSAILRHYGFLVTAAATVSEALDDMTNKDFDLLLCDLNIESEGDGYQLVRAMKEVNSRCVNIILTGHPALGSAIEGIHLGIDDYITKPVKPETLIALIAEKLAARERAEQSLSAKASLA